MLDILSCSIGGVIWSDAEMAMIPNITALVVTLIKVAIPIILIIMGMLDLSKAVMSNDEKEMKGAQTKLIKRVIYAVLVFLVVSIVQLVFGALGDKGVDSGNSGASISGCISCFVNGADSCK